MEVFPSAEPAGSPEDAARLVETARKAGADWVAVDGYAFGSPFQRTLTEAGLRLLAIDDHGRAGTYSADLILDPNLDAAPASYANRPPDSRLLSGLRYALLRREFRSRPRDPRATPAAARRLLVTLGGSDPDNVTLRVLGALGLLGSAELEVVVVVGPSNPHRASLEQAAQALPGSVRLEDNVEQMAERMAWAEAAVSAAGGTCWELMFLGVPSILVVAADNQRPNLAPIVASGAALSGEPDLGSPLRRLLSDAALRAELSRKGRELVDGKGAERAAAVLEAGLLRFRRATEADARLLWDWANDPDLRAVSFTTGPIPWETHLAWLRRKLADSRCALRVVTNETGVPVGQVRYDGEGPEAVVSISLAKEFRGRGWGAEILRRATAEYVRDGGAPLVRAFVKAGNRASERIFQDAGFVAGPRGAPGHPEASQWVYSRGQAG